MAELTRPTGTRRTNRRRFLVGTAAVAAGSAGCLGTSGGGGGEGGDGSDGGTTEVDLLPPPVRGDPEASVTVLAFEDFACPHCATFSVSVLPEILSQYAEPGHIRYEHHDFPIPVDEEVSWSAACAAREVQARGGDDAFFSFAHTLYERQSELGPELYETVGDEVGVDGAAVAEAGRNRAHEATVRADRQRGREAGVRGTPTVAVDGEVVEPTVDAISSAIEAARES